MLVDRTIEIFAGLLELSPLLLISHQHILEHGLVQGLQVAPNFARELESFDLGAVELGFKR